MQGIHSTEFYSPAPHCPQLYPTVIMEDPRPPHPITARVALVFLGTARELSSITVSDSGLVRLISAKVSLRKNPGKRLVGPWTLLGRKTHTRSYMHMCTHTYFGPGPMFNTRPLCFSLILSRSSSMQAKILHWFIKDSSVTYFSIQEFYTESEKVLLPLSLFYPLNKFN